MDEQTLRDALAQQAEALAVPGVAVGAHHDGAEHYAYHGVTSVENPLPVDEHTLFQFGSTGKTYTATAVLRLVGQGRVELDAPVRRYVPELRLKDRDAAEKVTVLQLLNHTAGWDGDLFVNTGDGDDALARFVAKMADIEQLSPPGESFSYNNAALCLAGRLIENVTADTYEQAIRELVFTPLGLDHSFFFPNEIMTRRFAVGHNQKPDGTIVVSRPWAMPRSGWPAGGISSNAGDLIAWARFHLGDGRAPDGTRLLDASLLRRMQEPTVDTRGSALGDSVGLTWLLRDVDGVRLVSHGGTTLGQHSTFVMVPERRWAITIMSNCGPNGSQLNDELLRWALEAYIGVRDVDPEPVPLGDDELVAYVGEYDSIALACTITARDGGLVLDVTYKPEAMRELLEAGQDAPDPLPPLPAGLLPGDGDRYIVTEGSAKGAKGYFARAADGRVAAMHLGGRLLHRLP